jgi:hypothetical protein
VTAYEWTMKLLQLRRAVATARWEVYHGQPEDGREGTYQALRDAEDALRLHLDNKSSLIL